MQDSVSGTHNMVRTDIRRLQTRLPTQNIDRIKSSTSVIVSTMAIGYREHHTQCTFIK